MTMRWSLLRAPPSSVNFRGEKEDSQFMVEMQPFGNNFINDKNTNPRWPISKKK